VADTLLVLGQAYPTAGILTTLYTVPAATSVASSSLMICNQTASTSKVRVSIAIAGAADTPAQYIRFDSPLLANEARTIVAGLTLATTDVVRVYSDTGAVSFVLSGVQVT